MDTFVLKLSDNQRGMDVYPRKASNDDVYRYATTFIFETGDFLKDAHRNESERENISDNNTLDSKEIQAAFSRIIELANVVQRQQQTAQEQQKEAQSSQATATQTMQELQEQIRAFEQRMQQNPGIQITVPVTVSPTLNNSSSSNPNIHI